MDVYAHRGASIELPENTLAAFARAIDLGAEGIELDTYRAKDGTAVVIHGDTLDRTTNGRTGHGAHRRRAQRPRRRGGREGAHARGGARARGRQGCA